MIDPSTINNSVADGSRRQTPPPPPSTNALCTPIKKRSPIQPRYSTLSRFRLQTIHTVGTEMVDFFVGPMPVGDFLNKFLPCDQRTFTPSQFKKGCFNEVIGAKCEVDAYLPFVTTLQQLVPELLFVDTHSRGDKVHTLVKPDVCVYVVEPEKEHIDHCIMASLDIHVEFKWHDGDNPFVMPSKAKDEYFVAKTAIDTLGQISTYAAAQLAAQYRTHAFSILIVCGTARLIRWDREGAIVTEPIAYNDDPSLVRFLALYSQASPQLRGIDTTVSLATTNEAETARKKLELPDGTKMFKTSIPSVKSGESDLTIVFPFPEIIPLRPACRATRACSAYNTDGKCVVFFKDSWRVNVPDTELEGKIYEILQAAQVPFVPHCLAHGVVNHEALQATQTKAHSELPWACKRTGEIMGHTHYRLVLDLVGKSLSTFTSSKQLVQAIHDALIAHKEAYSAKILHRDLSVGNIVISEGRGYLIDWDLAKLTSLKGPRQSARTGTWQFLSVRLIRHNDALHTIQDDIESAFWVLLWTTMVYSRSALSTEALTDFIRGTFNCSPYGLGKQAVFDSSSIFENDDLLPGRQVLHDLLKQLIDLFHWFHYKSNVMQSTALMKLSHVVSTIVKSPDNSISDLSSDLTMDVLKCLPEYNSTRAKQRLSDHTYVIGLFAEFLKKDWPADDAAQEQELISMEISGVAPGGRVYMSKSKHILETLKEVQGRKRRKTSHVKAPIHMADDPDLGLEEFESEEVDEETESDDSKALDIGSSSLTHLSDL